MTSPSPRPCLLFDLDGTLVDTDSLHLKAFNLMLEPLGKQLTEAYYKSAIMGFPNPMIMEALFPSLPSAESERLILRKESLFRDLARELEPLPGLLDLLDWADARGCPCGVVTNAPRDNAEMMLDAIGLRRRFETLVIGEELERAKPDPLPYLTGLVRLGGTADRTVAFEDSRSGVTAASGAGLHTVGLMTSLDAAALGAAGAVKAVRDFTDPTLLPFISARTGLG